MCRILRLLLVLFILPIQAEELTVLKETDDGVSPSRELETQLLKESYRHLQERKEALAKVKSQEDCREWQDVRREFFIDQIGGLRKPRPISGETTGALQGDGYRIEKILIASDPQFHITANLYLPPGEGPFPAVLIPCGHSHTGKASGQYQRAAILMAKNGMAALCYDPIGQGERYQLIDRTQKQQYFSGLGSRKLAVPHPSVQYLCTVEHTAIGLSSILLGSNTARLRIEDGMRCIDYLQSRDDIIADKIGCTGNSGGGTLTSYLMAVDDRIIAAAPGCFLTTFEKLLETKGIQDAEQNIFGQIAFGLDEPDYVLMRAPKPTLILAATRDATFNIDGTWDLFRQSKEFYTRLGYPERVEMVAADAPHGYHIQQREAAARFMHRWLLDEDKEIRELAERPDPLTDEKSYELNKGDWTPRELYCTPKGQALLMENENSVFQILRSREGELLEERSRKWSELDSKQKKEKIKETIGAESPFAFESETVGEIVRDGYKITKTILRPVNGVRVPGLLFIPDKPAGKATLYLHGEGMKVDAAPGGAIEKLVQKGHTVLAVDLRGLGETENQDPKRNWAKGLFGPNLQAFFIAYLNGRSITGMRCEDILGSAAFLSKKSEVTKIHLLALGETAVPALHAAALSPDAFTKVSVAGDFQTWADFMKPGESWTQAANIVHGAMRHYDLPDLIRLAESEGLRVEAPQSVFRRTP